MDLSGSQPIDPLYDAKGFPVPGQANKPDTRKRLPNGGPGGDPRGQGTDALVAQQRGDINAVEQNTPGLEIQIQRVSQRGEGVLVFGGDRTAHRGQCRGAVQHA